MELLERNHKNISFRDKLNACSNYGGKGELEDWISEDEEKDPKADDDLCCPTIKFSREKIRIRKPWKQSLMTEAWEVDWLQNSTVQAWDTVVS